MRPSHDSSAPADAANQNPVSGPGASLLAPIWTPSARYRRRPSLRTISMPTVSPVTGGDVETAILLSEDVGPARRRTHDGR